MRSSASSNSQGMASSSLASDEFADWIKQAAVGNRECQKRIYDYLAARSYRAIRKIVGPSNADDVMQDFIIHLFEKLSQFRFESSFDTWAHRMVLNQSLQYLRKTQRDEQRVKNAAWTKGTPHNIPELKRTEDAEMLAMAMQQISGEQRAILHMKEVEGLGYETISSILGIPIGTVGSRLNKARKELRNTMIELGWEV